jgi:uncharacterized protein YrrD
VHHSHQLIGKPIVSAETGHKLGEVADLLLDDEQGRLVGVVIGGGMFGTERVLPYGDVQTIGPDVIVARSESGVLDAKQWRERGTHAARTSGLKHRRVVTADGRDIGTINDICVDEKTGNVTGYDVTGRGLIRRHSIVRQSADVTIGRDVILIPDEEMSSTGQEAARHPSNHDQPATAAGEDDFAPHSPHPS